MRPSEALARHRDEVLEILKRYPVTNPRVFGSTARGEDTEESDLDILVEAGPRLSLFDIAKLEMDLELLLATRVDVRTPEDLSDSAARRVAQDARAL